MPASKGWSDRWVGDDGLFHEQCRTASSALFDLGHFVVLELFNSGICGVLRTRITAFPWMTWQCWSWQQTEVQKQQYGQSRHITNDDVQYDHQRCCSTRPLTIYLSIWTPKRVTTTLLQNDNSGPYLKKEEMPIIWSIKVGVVYLLAGCAHFVLKCLPSIQLIPSSFYLKSWPLLIAHTFFCHIWSRPMIWGNMQRGTVTNLLVQVSLVSLNSKEKKNRQTALSL